MFGKATIIFSNAATVNKPTEPTYVIIKYFNDSCLSAGEWYGEW